MFVFLKIEYIENQRKLEMPHKSLPLMPLTDPQALDLAETQQRAARSILQALDKVTKQ